MNRAPPSHPRKFNAGICSCPSQVEFVDQSHRKFHPNVGRSPFHVFPLTGLRSLLSYEGSSSSTFRTTPFHCLICPLKRFLPPPTRACCSSVASCRFRARSALPAASLTSGRLDRFLLALCSSRGLLSCVITQRWEEDVHLFESDLDLLLVFELEALIQSKHDACCSFLGFPSLPGLSCTPPAAVPAV